MSLKGRLGYHEIADLFSMLETTKKTGMLTVNNNGDRARLFFEWGELIRAESNRYSGRIGELLVERGSLSDEELESAIILQDTEEGTRRLGSILNSDFGIMEEEIQNALAHQFKSIVSDIMAWPGGNFQFDFELPSGMTDRFTLTASDYLMEVGIETGLIAKKALGEPPAIPAVIFDANSRFAEVCADKLRDHGIEACWAADPDAAKTALVENGAALIISGKSLETFAPPENPPYPVIVFGEGAPSSDVSARVGFSPDAADPGGEGFPSFISALADAVRGKSGGGRA